MSQRPDRRFLEELVAALQWIDTGKSLHMAAMAQVIHPSIRLVELETMETNSKVAEPVKESQQKLLVLSD